MTQQFFDNINENTKKLYEPWTKLNKAMLNNAEKVAEFSLNTMKNYSEMGLEHLRSASEVDSAETASNFNSKQATMFNTVSQQMLQDAQNLTELGNNMRNEIMEAMGDFYGNASTQMQTAMQAAADKATKTASEFTQTMGKATEEVMQAANKATETAKAATTATKKNTTSSRTSTAK